jgi:hypothetical protein
MAKQKNNKTRRLKKGGGELVNDAEKRVYDNATFVQIEKVRKVDETHLKDEYNIFQKYLREKNVNIIKLSYNYTVEGCKGILEFKKNMKNYIDKYYRPEYAAKCNCFFEAIEKICELLQKIKNYTEKINPKIEEIILDDNSYTIKFNEVFSDYTFLKSIYDFIDRMFAHIAHIGSVDVYEEWEKRNVSLIENIKQLNCEAVSNNMMDFERLNELIEKAQKVIEENNAPRTKFKNVESVKYDFATDYGSSTPIKNPSKLEHDSNPNGGKKRTQKRKRTMRKRYKYI